jgi:signal transduction histidine kinase
MRWMIAAAALVVLAISVALLIVTPDLEPERLEPGGRAVPYIGVVLVSGFVAVGAYAWLRRPENRTGALMVLGGVAVALSGLQFFDNQALLAIGVALNPFSISVLIHLLLAFPSGRVEGRWARRAVASAYIFGALQLPALLVMRCPECPFENPWLIEEHDVIASIFGVGQVLTAFFAVVVAFVVLLRRWRASRGDQRRSLEPVLLLGAVILALGVATVATQGTGAADVAQIAFFSAVALLPAAFLLGLVRGRFFRTAAVGRVIERLTRDPRDVRDTLAAEVGDPSLQVAYWLPERGYADIEGRAMPPPGEGRVVTPVEHEGRRVGALVHDARLCESPELLREVAAAASLALENARLEVELRARLEALRASRARLVEAGDAERRRLGRDLHDGAQQRLVALMIELQLARERFEADPAGAKELVDSAFANAQAAVGELRDLAAGIHPAVLSQRGLDAALESLRSRATLPVELESQLDERLPSPVETAAYFVVAEALTNVTKYAGATYARVEVRRENGAAVIDIRDDGVGGASIGAGTGLSGLTDRVGALDGTLEVESPPGAGTLVRARFPLGGAQRDIAPKRNGPLGGAPT